MAGALSEAAWPVALEPEGFVARDDSLEVVAQRGASGALAQRGQQIEAKSGPIGTPSMLYIDQENDTFYAAGDPAAGRHAAGLE